MEMIQPWLVKQNWLCYIRMVMIMKDESRSFRPLRLRSFPLDRSFARDANSTATTSEAATAAAAVSAYLTAF